MQRALLALAALASMAPAVAAQGTYTTFGMGCPGSAGVPMLSAFGDHQIGGSTIIQVVNLAPNQPAALLFGASSTMWNGGTLPVHLGTIGMTGCYLLVSPDAAYPSNTFSGVAQEFFNLPLQTSLIGQRLYNQYAAFDPGTSTPTKVVLSNGGKLVIGPACTTGAQQVTQGTFDVTVPPIAQLGTPQMLVQGSYEGIQQKICCGGPTSQQSGCTFDGTGTMTGSAGRFSFSLPPSVVQSISDALCAEVKNATLGIVSCTMTLGPLTVPSMRLNGTIGATKNDCLGISNWTGNANITFPQVAAVAHAKFKIDLLLTSINFSTDINLRATPTGSAKIQNNMLTATARVPSVRAFKTFTIPVVNISIPFSYTANTPQLQGSTSPVAMPPVPVTCQ